MAKRNPSSSATSPRGSKNTSTAKTVSPKGPTGNQVSPRTTTPTGPRTSNQADKPNSSTLKDA